MGVCASGLESQNDSVPTSATIVVGSIKDENPIATAAASCNSMLPEAPISAISFLPRSSNDKLANNNEVHDQHQKQDGSMQSTINPAISTVNEAVPIENKRGLAISLSQPMPLDLPHAKTPRSSEEKEATISEAPMVTGNFKPEEVRPFARPLSSLAKADFVFFLSHRGPDTKEALVQPLSFILKEFGIPHFFDQNDEAMQLGKMNSNQMSEAAWSARVGVVIVSDRFADSKWCLRELNTFLLRCHLSIANKAATEDDKDSTTEHPALLVPVYYVDNLMSQSKPYYPHMGQLSSILRKPDEAAHEFLATLVPRLVSIPAIQSIPSIQSAQSQIKSDPFVVKRLWNQYAASLVDKTEHKMFADPHPRNHHKKDLEVIKTVFKTLVPTDIKPGLEVYQPLEYALVPPFPNAITPTKRFSLDSLVTDLLQGNPIRLGEHTPVDEKDKNNHVHRNSTLTPSSMKVLLLQGAAGSGKSLFGWHLCRRYYEPDKESKEKVALPLFVSLPVFRSQILSNDASVTKQLLPLYFSKTYDIKDTSALQDQPLVIILDGLDELGTKINLYQACSLHVWRKAVFIITCRSDFLQESDISQYITPTNPLTDKPEPSWLGKLYLLPFNASQRQEYISKFASRHKDLYHWDAQQYMSSLDKFPQLGGFLQEPLLLFMILSVLPCHFSVSSSSSSASSASPLRRLDPLILEVQPVGEISWKFPQIRRAELYALFVEGWAEREIARLHVEPRPSVKHVLDFCSELAFEMFLHTRTSVTVASARVNEPRVTPKTFAERLKAKKAAPSIVSDVWAAQLFAEHETERTCSPLRKSGDFYAFLHKSLQEYFAARHMATNLVGHVLFEDDFGLWEKCLETSISSLYISQKRVTSDYSVLHFLAELIDQRIRSYRPPSPELSDSQSEASDAPSFQPYGRALFDILHANRHSVASCNAISILNAAGVGFQSRDFSRLDLSSDISSNSSASTFIEVEQKTPHWHTTLIPVADLSGANLSGCKLFQADLRGVRLENACLDFADIRGAAMQTTIFGQSSMFLGHTDEVTSITVSPDGLSLFSTSVDKTIRQWSVTSGTSIRVFEGHTDHVMKLALSTDGTAFFSCSWDYTIRHWEVETGSLIRLLQGHTNKVNAVILSRDDKTLFSGSDDRTIRLWSVAMGSCHRILHGHTEFIWCLALSVDGQTLYSGSGDKTICEWSIESGSQLRVLEGHTSPVDCIALSPDDKTLFSACDRTIREWSLDTGTVARILQGHSQDVLALSLSRDGESLFSGSTDMTIGQWSVDTGSLLRVFETHTAVRSIAFSPLDGATLFSASGKTIREWAIDPRSAARVAEGHTHYVNTLALHHKRLYSGAKDGTIREWCVETGSLVRVLEGQKDVVWSLVLSSDGQTLYSGFQDSSVGEWCVATGSLLHRFQGHTNTVFCVLLSGDDKTIFSGSWDNTIRSWSASDRSLIRVFQGHQDLILCLALSSDSRLLFSGSKDNTIRQWTVATGALVRVLEGHDGPVRALALSSDCEVLYSGSYDSTIRQWAVNSGSLMCVLKGHTGRVMTVMLSFHGKHLFSGSEDSTIRVWSVEAATVVDVLEGHSGIVLCLALSPDMQRLFSCSSTDRSVREWSLSSSESPSSSSSSWLQAWSSGPWSLSARHCQLDKGTRLAPRSRLLLTQCGANPDLCT